MVPHCPPTKHPSWLMAFPNHLFVINVKCHLSGMKAERVTPVDFALFFGLLSYWKIHPSCRNLLFCFFFCDTEVYSLFLKRGCKRLPSGSDILSDHFDLIVSWWDFTHMRHSQRRLWSDGLKSDRCIAHYYVNYLVTFKHFQCSLSFSVVFELYSVYSNLSSKVVFCVPTA